LRFREAQPRRADGGEDIFADPLRTTAEDTYGRVRGEYCITTSNIARWDAQCSVLIFNESDPLAFTRAQLRDYFRTALKWADAAHRADPDARFMVWMWNGGTAGGASIPHAHAQMGLGKGKPYPLVEGMRRAAAAYRSQYGADYFADLAAAHADVGLGFRLSGLDAFLYLTPVRMKDTWIIGTALDDTLADAVHDALRALIDRAGVRGFDVGVVMPPLYPLPGDDWSGFPFIARILDRGRPDALSSDIGAMDFFGARIIADDPYITRALLPF
jgi:glutathione S-transferase